MKGSYRSRHHGAGASLTAITLFTLCQGTAFAQVSQLQPSEADIIVTGVLRDTLASKAPVAVTNVSEQKIRDLVPLSAADLLSEVPGVVVTTDAGETRNTVYARGLSFGTSAGSFGYYWTSILEDGLPTIGGLFSNFQPDMFLRADATIKRVQAVRGGSAAVTGPNAPGGLFNYISKTGLTDPGGMAGLRLGVEGEGNIYQKADFYYGARNDDRTLGWSIGGNYRRSYGYRDTVNPLNKGGQVKANLNKVYDSSFGSGGFLLSLKWLDDHVGNLDNFRTLAHGFGPVVFDTPFGTDADFLPQSSSLAHAVRFSDNGKSKVWDPSDFSHYRTWGAGLKWDHDFGDGWKISNNVRVQRNQADHTYAEAIGAQSVLNSTTFTNLGTAFAGLNSTPGYFTLRDRTSGAVIARINQRTSASIATGGACAALCVQSTTPNLLPNQNLAGNSPIDSTNLILTVGGLNGRIRSDELLDLLTVTKTIKTFTITAGAYMSKIRFTRDFVYAGRGIMGLEGNPDPYDVSFTTTSATAAGGAAGTTYQLTDPSGFGAIGSSTGLTLRDRTHTQEISPLLGLTWEPTRSLLFDFGARYTFYQYHGVNRRFTTNTSAASRTFGGYDGDPLTLYDNLYAVDSVAGTIPYKKSVHYLQYTGAISYQYNDHLSGYVRFTKGRKNGDATWNGFDALYKVALTDITVLPVLNQYEAQITFKNRWLTFIPTLYYTDLDNVAVVNNNALERDGATRYTTPVAYSKFRSYGLELDNSIRFARWLDVRNVLTLNRAKSIKVAQWNLGICNGVPSAACIASGAATNQEDDYVVYVSGPQERAAKLLYNGTVNVHFGNLHGFYRFRYTGKRPTTVAATAFLPATKLSDVGLRYDVNRNLTMNFNVNNLFNDRNVSQIGQLGNLPAGLTQDQFIAMYPNALSSVQTNAPRSYYLSVTARF